MLTIRNPALPGGTSTLAIGNGAFTAEPSGS
jgi:hypothetical protein